MPSEIRSYIRSLAIDAYVVGGAVRDELLERPSRDEDFVVPGVDQAGLRALLAPHGRVEDMDVHGQLVGVRLHPLDRSIRVLAPAGIELTPPRAERSTGPGHRDFVIVSDASITLDEDMARRDFTINAMARRLDDGTLVDPFDGQGDLARRQIRTVGPTSFAEDPLRLLRGLRFVSQLGFDLEPGTLVEMRNSAEGLAYVSTERIGGGIKADGMGELSKLLLGCRPQKALLLARDTGVLEQIIPEFTPRHLEEHIFAAVQSAADGGARLVVRLACLLHDLGKVEAATILSRLRYPTDVQLTVSRIVAGHGFGLDGQIDALRARQFLSVNGDVLAFDLISHKHADLQAKPEAEVRDEVEALARFEQLVQQERAQPHRLEDLAVTGDDLVTVGFSEGPRIGHVLALLLDAVVTDPARNDAAWLLDRAREELA
ncbi:MAG: hypothetical protein WCJ67_00285 [Thermoleophilia bacterium]